MSRTGSRRSVSLALGSLGWPLLLGVACCSVFYAAILHGPFQSPMMDRYFAGHPVSYAETILFCIGLIALLMRGLSVSGELAGLGRTLLPPVPEHDREDAEGLLDALALLPARVRRSYLAQRLEAALAYVQRNGSAEGLNEELKYLADVDANRQHEGYGLIRMVIWATPMLGFLGTVVGITQALGNLNWEEFATSPQTAGQTLGAGLYVAFDTTALALTLSMILMFLQFLVDRLETQLLGGVDHRIAEELAGRFERTSGSADPQVALVQRMCQAVLKTSEQLVQRQVQLWQTTIDAAHQHWQQVVHTSVEQIDATLSGALDRSLARYSERLSSAEQAAATQLSERAQQWQTLLSDNARMMHGQQKELAKQGEILLQVVQATGDVVKLEKALNGNLQALAGAKNFEDTVMSLSAAIHLLNTRLGHQPQDQRDVTLNKPASQGRAA